MPRFETVKEEARNPPAVRRIIRPAALSLIGLLGLAALIMSRRGEALAPCVTAQRVRSVRVGMPEREVLRLLGEPFRSRFDPTLGRTSLEYARAPRFARSYPMLWVHLKDGKVAEVYAKKYVWWGLDDEGIYGATDDGAWESAAFEAAFRR